MKVSKMKWEAVLIHHIIFNQPSWFYILLLYYRLTQNKHYKHCIPDTFNKINVKGLVIIDNPNVVIPITEFLSKFELVHIAPRTMDMIKANDYPTLVNIEISDIALRMVLKKVAKSLSIKEIFVIISQAQLKTNGLVFYLKISP